MWLIKFMLLVVLVQLARSECFDEIKTDQTEAERRQEKRAKTLLFNGEQSFTLALLDAINKATPNENVFFSPYSTFNTLLLSYFGARNTTEKSLQNVLNLNWAGSKMQILNAFRLNNMLWAKRQDEGSLEFTSANKIYFANDVTIRECMKTLFDEELENLDFARNPDLSRRKINEWVEEYTKGHIKDLLIPDAVSAATKMVIANAAYFKGQWESKFDPEHTKMEVFHISPEKHVFVDMMSKTGTFNHVANDHLGAHILELPYKSSDGEVSMLIFLPPSLNNGLENMLSKLTPESFQYAINDGLGREIEVKLPRFSFEKTVQLKPVLERLGVGNLFETSADLSGFGQGVLNFDDAVHKAKIEVDEEGSTAAAATALFSFRSSRPLEPTQFFCDHPFLFFIYDRKSEAILFTGIYRGPDN